MDVPDILAPQAQVLKNSSTLVEKDIPLDIDAGFLTVTDPSAIDKESYDPKRPTKWQRFARAKGISSQRRDKKIWDDERQAWVSRWGWKGKNRDEETPWLHEVPANADADDDPSKEARVHLQNVARAQQGPTTTTATGAQVDRKRYVDRTLATTRTSTASMGKFDRAFDGEKTLRGVKRKFDLIEKSVDAEKNANIIIKQIGNGASGSSSKKSKRDGGGGAGDVVNVRKTVSFASGGQGAAALARKSGSGS
ncbi:ribosome biogenesis regulatory protein-domain-containing protein [Lactarius indigo]|nr:ribosome biogenesis regulatory protein-domain-containing protein [Lactarius indigo]